jgi:hypothetical protein
LPVADRLEAGQHVHDPRAQQDGVVLDYACQYAHPKADPVYSYLIKWDDGQIQAVSEAAVGGPFGIEPLD